MKIRGHEELIYVSLFYYFMDFWNKKTLIREYYAEIVAYFCLLIGAGHCLQKQRKSEASVICMHGC